MKMNDNGDEDDNDCEPGQRSLSSLPRLSHHAVSDIINWKK